jgi:DNA polymerase-3 subunit alpha
MNYVPLHCHSDASPDGAGTVCSLVQRASEIGVEAMALTDHGTLANSVSFAIACQDEGIQPILGMEAYLLYNGKNHHVTLLSLNKEGFDNLIKLDSWSHRENYIGGFPLITLPKLEEHRTGIYALTGCASSALFSGSEAEAANYISDLSYAVGRENVALEVMFIGSHDVWSRPLKFASRLNLPYVITNDTHYPCSGQFAAHQAISLARKGFNYDSRHLWLKTADEIIEEGWKYVDRKSVVFGLRTTRRCFWKLHSEMH